MDQHSGTDTNDKSSCEHQHSSRMPNEVGFKGMTALDM